MAEKYNTSDSLAIALTCVAAVMAIVLFLLEKTPFWVVTLLMFMLALSIYPILHFVRSRPLRALVFIMAVGGTVAFGWAVWPTKSAESPYLEITQMGRSIYVENLPLEFRVYTLYHSTVGTSGMAYALSKIMTYSDYESMPEGQDLVKIEDEWWEKFDKGILLASEKPVSISFPPNEETYFPMRTVEPLDPEMARRLNLGRGFVLLMGRIYYTTPTGTQTKEWCVMAHENIVMTLCSKHNN